MSGSPPTTRAAPARRRRSSRRLGTPCLIHQPSYSLVNRWIETDGLLDALADEGIGAIVFSPLAQGLLTDKYLNGVPADSRAAEAHFFKPGSPHARDARRTCGR